MPVSFTRELKGRLRGLVIGPGEAGYDDRRQVFNAAIQRYPAAIAQCDDAADVAASVRCARERDLEIAVRGGGHSVAGFSVCDDGLVIDLSTLKRISVSTDSTTVTCGAGATWAEMDGYTAHFGRATPGGVVSSTGVAGLTLGGGVGWLVRKHGLTCDNLLSAEMVTADGQLVLTDEGHYQDLFWGLRGGGGNFGVVTSLAFRLHPVPGVIGGKLDYPINAADLVLAQYADFVPQAADELTLSAAFNWAGPTPTLSLVACCCASQRQAWAAVRPIASFAQPVAGALVAMPYVAMQRLLDPAFPPGQRHYWKTTYLEALSAEVTALLRDWFVKSPSPLSMILVESYSGAAARVDPSQTAYPHRRRPFNVHIVAAWDVAGADAANIAWATDVSCALQPFAAAAEYANFLTAEDCRPRRAFADNYDRLAEVKHTWDPANTFRYNVNVDPQDADHRKKNRPGNDSSRRGAAP